MENPKQLIIIGGGASIREGVEKGLWTKLEGRFVIGINFSYKFFPNPTIHCYLDKQVREKNEEDFRKLGLVITKKQPIKNHKNEIQITTKNRYHRNINEGIYKGALTGIYALSLGIHLLDIGEIYLLGYDFGNIGTTKTNQPLTHFYQGTIKHRGIGKVNYYKSKDHATRDFGVFDKEQRVKIYNVSIKSKLGMFQKITYDEFFKRLDRNKYNQNELRQWIKDRLPKIKDKNKKK